MRNKVIIFIEICVIFLFLMGIAVNRKPILREACELADPTCKTQPKKGLLTKTIYDPLSSTEESNIPDWVRQAVTDHLNKASYSDLVSGYRAIRQHNWDDFEALVERYRRLSIRRESPGLDESPASPLDFTSDRRVNDVSYGMQFQPAVCTGSDGIIYVTWGDDSYTGNWSIYFSKSTDGGATFTSRVLVDGVGQNMRPRIAVSGVGSAARVYIAYTYIYDAEYYDYDIYLSYSTNGGTSFGSIVGIGTSTSYEDICDIVADNAHYVYLAYTYGYTEGGGCDAEEAEVDIVLRVSPTGGTSWYSGVYIASQGDRDEYLPSLAVSGSGSGATLHFAYTYDPSGGGGADYDVYYKKITSAGSGSPSIGPMIPVATDVYDELVVPGGIDVGTDNNPQLAYIYNSPSTGDEIYYRRSYDYGGSFAGAVPVAVFTNDQTDATIALDPLNNPFIVYRDSRTGPPHIYLTWSSDQGISFNFPRIVNTPPSPSADSAFWPTISMYKPDWVRRVDIVWWDKRYDDGDIYYNGNLQNAVSLDVNFIPDTYTWGNVQFQWWAFGEHHDTTLMDATYQIWYDPDPVNFPLLDQYWSGSSASERWASVVIPSAGWNYYPPDYWVPVSPGAYTVNYYHQYYVTFHPQKGNPTTCPHTMTNAFITYYSFGAMVDTSANNISPVATWCDKNSAYTFVDTMLLSPHQRWASVSGVLGGIITGPITIDPLFYHQWKPVVFFAGLSDTNTVCTIQHYQCNIPHLECGLWDSWSEWTDCGSYVQFESLSTAGYYAIDPTTIMDTSYFTTTIRYLHEVTVRVRNDFGAGTVIVDGVTYPSPYVAEWGPSTVHSIAAVSPQAFGDSVRYIFDYWSDTGDSAHDVIIPTYSITYTAYFVAQYHVTITWTGPTGGHVPELLGEGWYEEGSLIPISTTPVFDSLVDIRYGFSHWSSFPEGAYIADISDPSTNLLVDGWYDLTANYSIQYLFAVYNPGGYDSPYPPIGEWWYNAGTAVAGSTAAEDPIHCVYCSGYHGTGSLGDGTGNSFSFYIGEPSSVTWQWSPQLILQVISEYGTPMPPMGYSCITPGTEVTAFVPSPFYIGSNIRATCIGWTGTGSVPPSGSGNMFTFTMNVNSSITWLWVLEYRFTVNNPLGIDTPIPPVGSYWYPNGTEVTGSVTSPFGDYVCIGFIGTGSLPSSPMPTFAFIINSPSSVTWQWADFEETFSLTVNSPYGNPRPFGTTYYVPGTNLSARVTSPYYDTVTEGVRYILDNFVGTGSAPSGTDTLCTFIINMNSTITWNWHTQYRFVVNNPHGYDSPVPPVGEYWYDTGTLVTGSITSPVEDTIICTGYTGTGSLVSDTTLNFSFNISSPSSVTWEWLVEIYRLTVYSDYGTPDPPVGENNYSPGTEITATVDPSIPLAEGERMSCTGYTGTGSVPPSGTGNSVTFTINAHSSITWHWQHQYRLVVDNPGGYDTPVPPEGENWFEAGGFVDAFVTSPAGTMYCVGYYGAGDLPDTVYGYDHAEFFITQPSQISWIWLGQSSVVRLDVFSSYGEPYPDVGLHYYPRGVNVNAFINRSDSIGVGRRYFCEGFTGSGSVPSSGSDTLISFIINSNSTVSWHWSLQYRFIVYNPGGYDSPYPAAGTWWFESGSEINGSVVSPDDTMYCIGYEGTGALGSGVTPYFSFNLTSPSTVEWLWAGESDVVSLTVSSEYGNPDPPVGTFYYLLGSLIEAQVESELLPSPGVRQHCTGWEGTGSVPSTGDTAWLIFAISRNSVLDWSWDLEYFLDLDYSGTGGLVPWQVGEGWHAAGSEVTIKTENPIDGGFLYYGFIKWESFPPGASIANPFRDSTSILLNDTYLLTAEYDIAVPCTVRKEPPQELGVIYIDGTEYYDPVVPMWWAERSVHNIGVSTPDSSDEIKYTFSHWNDGGALFHNTPPIIDTANFVAFYDYQYRCRIEKDPLHENGWIRVDRDYYYDDTWEGWMDPSVYHEVEVSEIDEDTDLGIRYLFNNWSDGGDRMHIIDFSGGPLFLTAYYDRQAKCTILKEPYQRYGSITLGDSTYYGVGELVSWLELGETYQMGVSWIDISSDSSYTFAFWSDGGARFHEIGPIAHEVTYIAYYNQAFLIFDFEITPPEWYIGLMNVSETKSMDPRDGIFIENSGNVPLQFSLNVSNPGAYWTPGVRIGYNQFVLRGHFNDLTTPPDEFHPYFDVIKGSPTLATDFIFGPEGDYLAPDDDLYLWLQFLSPIASTVYEEEQILILTITGHIPLE
ncbi:hypothetical protein JW877_06850 [bacterium]|nr:hypothetical protein [bacterium]